MRVQVGQAIAYRREGQGKTDGSVAVKSRHDLATCFPGDDTNLVGHGVDGRIAPDLLLQFDTDAHLARLRESANLDSLLYRRCGSVTHSFSFTRHPTPGFHRAVPLLTSKLR